MIKNILRCGIHYMVIFNVRKFIFFALTLTMEPVVDILKILNTRYIVIVNVSIELEIDSTHTNGVASICFSLSISVHFQPIVKHSFCDHIVSGYAAIFYLLLWGSTNLIIYASVRKGVSIRINRIREVEHGICNHVILAVL